MNILSVILIAVFIDNAILSSMYGVCPFLGVSKKFDQASGMGIAVTFVMLLATAVTWPIYHLILMPTNLTYLRTILFILVIASLVQLVEIVLKKYIPALYASLGVYLPLITTNCAVLGIAGSNIDKNFDFLTSMANALGCGIGFWLVMVLFAGVRSRVEEGNPPKAFKGLPVTLVAAAIMALCFRGFGGVIDNLFG